MQLIKDLLKNSKENNQSVEIKYNTPIEVSEKEYPVLMASFREIIAGRKDEATGKYYIKLWLMKYKKQLAKAFEKLRATEPEH